MLYGGKPDERNDMFGDQFTEEEFNNCFSDIDIDGSGTITKEEML